MRVDLGKHTSTTIALADVADVIAAAREVLQLFDNDTAWWRGHANRDWPLAAQVFRTDPKGIRRYEDQSALIGHFVSRAPTRSYRACPDRDDYFGWLFLAQHYGLPTRLLDWTENPLVALYFAVNELKEDDGCLWTLWPGGLNREMGASTGLVQIRDPRVEEIEKGAFFPEIPEGTDIIAIDGREIDPRMLAQMTLIHAALLSTTNGNVVREPRMATAVRDQRRCQSQNPSAAFRARHPPFQYLSRP